MRVRLASFVLVILALEATTVAAANRPRSRREAASQPPRELHLAGDHWTAWNPPAPDPTVQTYVIVKGDTLWDLAKRFYGNPYLWPQLWEKNQYILDAHWIYPGDPLVTGIQVAPVQNLAETNGTSGATGGGAGETMPAPEVPGVESAVKAAGAPVPLGAESDIYCSGYISDAGEQFNYSIVGSEYDNLTPKLGRDFRNMNGIFGTTNAKVDMSTGDIVYISGGALQGLSAGSLFTVVGAERPVIHPITHVSVGSFYQYLGRVRILSVQDTTAIAEIVHSCDSIHLGNHLRPFEPEPVPLGRNTAQRPVNLVPPDAKLADAATIVYTKDEIVSLGQDHVVFIDRGADQNVTPGDVFTIYRTSDRGMPALPLGELAILSVQKRTALAKITESRYPVFVGDRLDPK